MKNALLAGLFFCVALAISSCHKSNDSNVNVTKCSDTSGILTSKTWVYYEYFKNFNDPATTLAWKTNRTSNSLNLSTNQIKFNCDSTYTEIDEYGNTLKGTWTYLNNGTQVQVTNSKGIFTSTIQVLTGRRYEWLEANGNYGVMVPQNLAIDTTGGRLQLLTSKPWVYSEYFKNFSQTSPSLVWKSNKANSTFNLSRNIVKYNTDGTYTETDQNGTIYNGTWTFLDNQKQVRVYNSVGTFTSSIMQLSTDRYEWFNIDGTTYGEMVHP
jgi:hypothetical protein